MLTFVAAAGAQSWTVHPLGSPDGASSVLPGGPAGPDDGVLVNGNYGTCWYPPGPGVPVEASLFYATPVFADFDGDGVWDVAEGHYWRDGSTRFAELVDYPEDATEYPYRFADLDGDGDVDPFGNHRWSENVGGTAGRIHPFVGFQATDAIDWDADGDLDLSGVGHAQRSGWTENVGGSFVAFHPDADVAYFSPLDLDGDGDLDLVHRLEPRWRPERGAGIGPSEALVAGAWAQGSADLDGDGVVELLVVDGTDVLAVPWVAGAPGVPAPLLAWDAIAVGASDLDGDGDLDLAGGRGTTSAYAYGPRYALPSEWAGNPGYPDRDADGLSDAAEAALGTDPDVPDTDGDGLDDRAERLRWRTDPTDPADADGIDLDGDGLDAAGERAAGTEPAVPDTDADGLRDGAELARGTDPQLPDTDGDGLDDGLEASCGGDPLDAASMDRDCDGLDDAAEAVAGTDSQVADTDGDGLDDGLEAAESGTDPTLADTDGGGRGDPEELAIGADPTDARDDWRTHPVTDAQVEELAVADLDGDGDLDVITRDADDHQSWLEWPSLASRALPDARALRVADLDGDGAVDLLLSGAVAWGPQLAPDPLLPLGLPAALDVDGDGDLDLLVDRELDRIVVENQGGRTFAGAGTLAGGGCRLAIGRDLDGDGLDELVCGAADRTEVAWNRGAFAFDLVTWPAPSTSLAVGDLDGNGGGDVVHADLYSTGSVAWWRGGDPAWDDAPSEPWQLAALDAADVDGDGVDEALVSSGGVAVFDGGPGGLAATRWLDGAFHANAGRFADLDGDGDLDVVVAGYTGVVWLENPGACWGDQDGDGFGAGLIDCAAAGAVGAAGDCDDADPDRYPGAFERCDGRDDDCTGAPDDPVDTLATYADVDGDGFGAGVPTVACDVGVGVWDRGDCDDADAAVHPLAGEVACNLLDDDCAPTTPDERADVDGDGAACADCDETDASVSPGAPELCDGLDQDCDGLADEDLAVVVFVDGDGDGVGGERLETCDPPPGAVAVGGDCDDTDPGVVECASDTGATAGDPAPRAKPAGGCGCDSGGSGVPWGFLAVLSLARRRAKKAESDGVPRVVIRYRTRS